MEQEPKTSSVVTSRPRTTPTDDRASWFMVFGVAGQLAWMLALPAVFFVIGGAWLDKQLGTSPLCVAIGIPIALLVSALGVRSMLRKLP